MISELKRSLGSWDYVEGTIGAEVVILALGRKSIFLSSFLFFWPLGLEVGCEGRPDGTVSRTCWFGSDRIRIRVLKVQLAVWVYDITWVLGFSVTFGGDMFLERFSLASFMPSPGSRRRKAGIDCLHAT